MIYVSGGGEFPVLTNHLVTNNNRYHWNFLPKLANQVCTDNKCQPMPPPTQHCNIHWKRNIWLVIIYLPFLIILEEISDISVTKISSSFCMWLAAWLGNYLSIFFNVLGRPIEGWEKIGKVIVVEFIYNHNKTDIKIYKKIWGYKVSIKGSIEKVRFV